MPTSLAPVVDARTRVLILGSMPGEVSLQMQQYYAHPRNAFWDIMSRLLGFDRNADYRDRLLSLLAAGIGLWDVLHICDRPGSLDSAIVRETMEVNDFGSLFAAQPNISQVCFNGAKAEQVFRRLVAPALGSSISCARLPSTSPANAAMPYGSKLEAWRAVLDVPSLRGEL
jgi:double-stranded uracil-DNA glycosylase